MTTEYELTSRLIDRLESAIADVERAERHMRLLRFALAIALGYIFFGWAA